MKTLVKTFAIFLVVALASLSVNAQKYEHKIDSVSFSEGVNYEHYTTVQSDSICKISDITGGYVSVKDIAIRFVGKMDVEYVDLAYVDIEIKTFVANDKNRPSIYKERIFVSLWEEDEEHEFGVGTIVVAGERANGEWFMYAQNLDKKLYSFHFVNLEKEKDIIIYATKK